MIATIIKSMDEVTPQDVAPLILGYHSMLKLPELQIEAVSDWCSQNWPSAPMISIMDIKDFDLEKVLVSHCPPSFFSVLMTASLSTQLQSETSESELFDKIEDISLLAFIVKPNLKVDITAKIINRIHSSCNHLGVSHPIDFVRRWVLKHPFIGYPKFTFADNADYEVTDVIGITVDDEIYEWLIGMHMFNAFCSQDGKIQQFMRNR